MIDFTLDIVNNKIDISYNKMANDLSNEWKGLRKNLLRNIKAQIKGCRRLRKRIRYIMVYNLLEIHLYLLAFKYYNQTRDTIGQQKKYCNPDYLIYDLFRRLYPFRYRLINNWQIKIQCLSGILLLITGLLFQQQWNVLFILGFLLTFYGTISLLILTMKIDDRMLMGIVNPLMGGNVYLYKNLKNNQRSTSIGAAFILSGFLIQLLSIFAKP